MESVESAPIDVSESIPVDEPQFDGIETQDAPPPEPVNRSTSFEIDGKQYAVNEEQIRKYYGIPATEDISDKEWKTIISNYKTNIQYNNKNREASQIKRTMEEAFKKLYDTPKDTLKILFQKDPERLKATLEEMLLEEIEEEMLPQEARELKKAQKELEDYKKLIQQQEEVKRQAEQEALEAHYTQEIESEIIQAIEGGGVPKTPATVRRIAHYLLQGANRGYDLKPKDVIKLVKEDYEIEIKEMFGSAAPDLIAQFLGEGKMKELSKAQIQKVKQGFADRRNLPSPDGPVEYEQPRRESWQDAKERARQRIQKLK
jgi:hypothetical protein